MTAEELKQAILALQMVLSDYERNLDVELQMPNGYTARASECVLVVRDDKLMLSIRAKENR